MHTAARNTGKSNAPENLLAFNFAEFAVNVGDRGDNAGNNDVIESVDSTIRQFNGFIQSSK
jgi:hypothetical protein